MEFSFDVNQVLPFEITILNGDYRVLNPGQAIRISASDKLTSIIDAIGDASYKAQGLFGAVTTARKFRTSDHRLYIIKKATDNKNLGSVIGILKVGPKHLYIHDARGQVHERTPLCILDFYVHESKQRLGYGKRLFDAMLEFEKCVPYELAIDRPSNKCLAFLHKHYNLSSPIHQVNNFVVYHGFFNPRPSVVVNTKPVISKERHDLTSWLASSEKQNHKSISELERYQRKSNTSDNDQPATTIRSSPATNEHQSTSYYTTSYDRQYKQNTSSRGQTDPSLPQSNINQVIPTSNQSSILDKYRTPVASTSTTSKLVPPNSVYTAPTNNHRQQQQQSTMESTSSAWRVLGIPQTLN